MQSQSAEKSAAKSSRGPLNSSMKLMHLAELHETRQSVNDTMNEDALMVLSQSGRLSIEQDQNLAYSQNTHLNAYVESGPKISLKGSKLTAGLKGSELISQNLISSRSNE